MTNAKMPIGVLDSGVGGLSVLKELIACLPHENFIYLGDTANAPYGTKTMEQVRALTFSCVERLIQSGIKALVLACNTATGASVYALREAYPQLPIIGIEPAIKPAMQYKEKPTVVVMATPLTLHQEKFLLLMNRFTDEANIIPLPCDGLMEMIEEGFVQGEKIDAYLTRLFSTVEKSKVDCVVLGCTHYPHAKNAIVKALGGGVHVFDGGEGTARETKRRLAEATLLNRDTEKGHVQFLFTKDAERKLALSYKLLEGIL